jgi:hypothetical protein
MTSSMLRTSAVTREAYIKALLLVEPSISKKEGAFLRAHYHSPAHTVSATALARRVGYSQYRATNLIYGRLAAKLCDIWGAPIPRTHRGIGILLEGYRKSLGQHWQLEMRPALVAALDELGWYTDSNLLSHSEDSLAIESETEAFALRDSRLGQARFRAAVIDYWGACAVTGCAALELLSASHIKPWKDSTDSERLDPFNGILLTPNLHSVFDVGLISFGDDGCILLSSLADLSALHALCIHAKSRIDRLSADHMKYLEYHRNHVFTS